MKKLTAILISVLIFALAAVSADAFSVAEYAGYEFINDIDDSLSITAYTGSDSALIVPETVYNKTVKRFDEKALKGNTVVNTVIMHDNMTMIRQRAFYQCSKLSYVYYSKGLEVLSKYAFAYNDRLDSAFLRNTVIRELGDDVYLRCLNLEYVSLPDTLETICGSAFESTNVRKIVIPSNVGSMSGRSFAHCENLEKVYVPASVTTIGTDVFLGCPNLTVYTPEDSAMYEYCADNGINCAALSEEDFPSRLSGDTNGDRELNINDVTYIQRELAGYKFDFCPDNCDYNGDCKLNINDATMIQLKLLGYI